MLGVNRPKDFHERFNIEVDIDEAKRRFMNRVSNLVFMDLYHNNLISSPKYSASVPKNIAYRLGDEFSSYKPDSYVKGNFKRCLHVLEAMYETLEGSGFANQLSTIIDRALMDSEVDLGINWQPPIFVRTGARLLDERCTLTRRKFGE